MPDRERSKLNYIWAVPRDTDLNNVQKTLLPLVSKCSLALGDGFDVCKMLLEAKRIEAARQVFLLRILLDSCHLTSESVLILIGNCKFWDADILIRSVVEGSVKFAYLSYGSQHDIDQKIAEYDDILPEVNRLKRHRRIESFLEVVDNPEAVEWKAFRDLLLTESDVGNIDSRFPNSLRRSIEQKWSFHRLLQALSSSGIPELRDSMHLYFNYGMSSHVLHQDADGVGMIWERNNRAPVRRDAVELAHAGRMLSDLMTMNLIRHAMSLHLSGQIGGSVLSIYHKYADLMDEVKSLTQNWSKVEYGESIPEEAGGEEGVQ